MDAEKSCCRFPDLIAWGDVVPTGRKMSQPLKGERHRRRVKRTIAFEERQGGKALEWRSPPHQHLGIFRRNRLEPSSRFLVNQQRHNRRSIPELHRLSRRSARSAATAEVSRLERGG